jgi:2-hydroxychromene-2-carboxylate isomerase
VTPVLYFDLGSPYGWLAVERAAAVLGVEPELEPILLGAVFQKRGWGSWGETDRREEGMAEVERRARAYGLPPVVWPPGWPPNTLAAMRAAVWAKGLGRGAEFARAAYRLAFVEGRDLGDPGVVPLAADAAGLPAAEVPTAVQDPAVKAALRAATDAAWEAGVRGVPTVRIGSDCYYGDDRLDEAAERSKASI